MHRDGWNPPSDREIATAADRAAYRLTALWPGDEVTVFPRRAGEMGAGGYDSPIFIIGVAVVTTSKGRKIAYRMEWDVQTFAGQLVRLEWY